MKSLYKNSILILFMVFANFMADAQDQRTLETKVADILAQFPAESIEHTDRLMGEMIELDVMGIARFCDMIIPPGSGDDTQARFALESLARFSGAPGHPLEQKIAEGALLAALDKARDKEVKAFFIRRLNYCGSNNSIPVLSRYLADEKLYSPAVATLTTIGTGQAGAAIFKNLNGANGARQIAFVKALGVLEYQPAETTLIQFAESSDGTLLSQSLYALASIGQTSSLKTMMDAAKNAGYQADKSEVMIAYIRYAKQLAQNGHISESNKLGKNLLKKCKAADQLHWRSGGVDVLRANQGPAAITMLLKEFKNEDRAYRGAVLEAAQVGMSTSEVDQWINVMSKVSPDAKVQIIHALAKRPEPQVLNACIVPSLKEDSKEVRIAAIQALALNQKGKAVPVLMDRLSTTNTGEEISAIKMALMQTVAKDQCALLANTFEGSNEDVKTLIIEVIAARGASDYFDLVLKNCTGSEGKVEQAAYQALQSVASSSDLDQLLALLDKTEGKVYISAVQQAVIAVLKEDRETNTTMILKALNQKSGNEKLIPILPYLQNKEALSTVTEILKDGTTEEKAAAYEAITSWQDTEAIPELFNIISNNDFKNSHSKSIAAYLKQVSEADFPDDQKLLLVRKVMPMAKDSKEKTMILQAAGNIKTFLSLIFVSQYMDDKALASVASSSAMRIILPSTGQNDGLSGDFVLQITDKVMAGLTGPDSQYMKIDIQEYLDKMSREKGYVALFNGKDLNGWQGLVENPIERSKMSEKKLAEKQIEANEEMKQCWSVKDGSIVFNGKGHNLCSVKKYGDFEMLVDWRITKDGDSGIYLRGSPQVQIWDWTRKDAASSVGSGGLFNNQENPDKPLVVADNPIGDWNTFRIKMIGEKVTVHLNGVLVVDNVTMENYWDRSIPIFPKEAIELQAHGNELAFRDIYVREISSGEELLTEEEKAEGFVSLFNGRDLDYWIGNKTDYLVQDNMIAVRPKMGGHGNLWSAKEYTNYIFRFEFQLTPGANNGLGIRAPLEGDGAYAGIELQILDNTAAIYANLEPYQYHGSAYGIIPAKRGHLNPVGEWNYQEVILNGDDIKVTLNGHVILDGNLKEASKNGTMDKKEHPGLKRTKGHIGFLGHGSELQFRNIRIKELP